MDNETRIKLEAVRGTLLAAMTLAAEVAEQHEWDLLWILDVAKAHSAVVDMLEPATEAVSDGFTREYEYK